MSSLYVLNTNNVVGSGYITGFTDASITNITGQNSYITNINTTNITGIDINSTNIRITNISGTNNYLNNSQLISLTGTNIYTTNISGANAIFNNCSVTNFTGGNMTFTDFVSTNLSSVNFTGTNVFITSLTGTNAIISNLSGTNTRITNLTGTNAFISNLSGTVARIINITGSTVYSNLFSVQTGDTSTAFEIRNQAGNVTTFIDGGGRFTSAAASTVAFRLIVSSIEYIKVDTLNGIILLNSNATAALSCNMVNSNSTVTSGGSITDYILTASNLTSAMVGGIFVGAGGKAYVVGMTGSNLILSRNLSPGSTTAVTGTLYYNGAQTTPEILNSRYSLGNLGIGCYNSLTGTVAQSGTTITGVGFVPEMVGGSIRFTSGTFANVYDIITSYSSSTSITVANSRTVSAGTTYLIYYGGIVTAGDAFSSPNNYLNHSRVVSLTGTNIYATNISGSNGNFSNCNITSITGATNIYSTNINATNLESIGDTLNIATNNNTANVNIALGSSIQIVNIGNGNPDGNTTINIGGSNDTVNIVGNLVYVNSTVTNVLDPYFNLNYSGATGSAGGAGMYIYEGATATGYFRINSTRDAVEFKAPLTGNMKVNQSLATTDDVTFNSITGVSSINSVNENIINSNVTNFSGTNNFLNNSSVVSLTGTNISSTNISSTNINSDYGSIINFSGTDNFLNNSTVVSLTGTNIYATNISGTNINADYGSIINFSGTDNFLNNSTVVSLTGTNIYSTNISGTNAIFNNSTVVSLTGTNIYATNISGTNAIFNNCSLVSLTGTNIYATNISGTNAIFNNCSVTNFTGGNMTFTDFAATNLSAVNITGTNFTFTMITGNSGYINNLSGSTLSYATIVSDNWRLERSITGVYTAGTAFNINLLPFTNEIYNTFGSNLTITGSNIFTNTSGKIMKVSVVAAVTRDDSGSFGFVQWLNLKTTINGVTTYITGSSGEYFYNSSWNIILNNGDSFSIVVTSNLASQKIWNINCRKYGHKIKIIRLGYTIKIII
jgi:trimeric autotransporter adhesin